MSNKRPQPRRDFRDSAYAALHRKGVVTAVYLVLRQFLHGNFENVFFCVLSLVLFLMPTILERQLQIDLPNVLEIVILLFIFSAWILGEVQTYYTIIPYWDTMLHTLNGFLCAAGGPAQPPRAGLPVPVPGVHGHCGLLLLHDGGRALGVL